MANVKTIEPLYDEGDSLYLDPRTKEPFKCLGVVDWKETPEDVLEQCNKLLEEQGLKFEFKLIEEGSDQYVFILDERNDTL